METLPHPAFLTALRARVGLERHAFERVLYLFPIVLAGFLFGQRGAVITSLAALAAMVPRVILLSLYPRDSIVETAAVFALGNLVAFSFESLRKERKRRSHLASLNQTASVVSQSLELGEVLQNSLANVVHVMRVDVAMVFLLNEATAELNLAAYSGVSDKFAQGVDRIKLGEGLNGRVAMTGEPLYVVDASRSPDLTRMIVSEEDIHSQLTVPLQSKRRVVGTLSVAMRSFRQFPQDEVDLLTGIANQIGVAVENARLYEKQREVVKLLLASEERYRKLFESAHDAIWLQDLEGRIIAANRACETLTGRNVEELIGLKAGELLSEESGEVVGRVEQELLLGKAAGFVSEVKLIKKGAAEVHVQLSSSLIEGNGHPTAIQHIARDVTEEKRMRENLRLHLQESTRAQEDERKRIARELHDDTIQSLVVLSRQLDALATGGKGLSKEKRLVLEHLRTETNGIAEGVRRLCQHLRPATLDRLGLLPALEWLASDIGEPSVMPIEVKVLGIERRLPPEVELMLFRIVQEALMNAWRHSQATHVQVTVEFEERRTKIVVEDNGKGFELPDWLGDLPKAGKLGLAGMQERARLVSGTLSIQSSPGKGTKVTTEVPW